MNNRTIAYWEMMYKKLDITQESDRQVTFPSKVNFFGYLFSFSHFLPFLVILCCLVGCGISQENIRKRDQYLYRAQVYYQNKKYLNSLQQIQLALDLDPTCKRAFVSQGWTFYFLKKYEEAKNAFMHAYHFDDTDPWMHYGLGAVHYKEGLGIDQKIFDIHKRIAEQTPEHQKALLQKYKPDIARLKREKNKLFDKSLEHFRLSSQISSKNIDLYKMIAMVYASKGLDYYPQAIKSMDKFLNLLDKELEGTKNLFDGKQRLRLSPDLSQKKREIVDAVMGNMTLKIDYNRKQYRSAQTVAAEWCYQLEGHFLKLSRQSQISEEQRKKYQKQMNNYADEATRRLRNLAKTTPGISQHYRNLAKVANMQGKYQDAAAYLKKYISLYPLAAPKSRVEAKMELKRLQKKAQDERTFR